MKSKFSLEYPNSVLLETNLVTSEDFRNFLFIDPIEILVAYTLSDVQKILNSIESYIDQNYYLAGYLTYEAGYLFENNFRNIIKDYIYPYPLLWFGVYKDPIIEIKKKMKINEEEKEFSLENISFTLDEDSYKQKIQKVLKHIEKGETYQVNFTFGLNFNFEGSVDSLYNSLKNSQRVSYSAAINDGEKKILSLSPELFFRRNGNMLYSKPMKGTIGRGNSDIEDNALIRELQFDSKSKAENSMIVDLIRNDIGKISKIGKVKVEELMKIEKYETLFQLTSTIRSELKENITYYDLFKALFPGGSITGVPKIKTMQIIRDLENSTRGIYTGAIGFISKKESIFNIPIRTIEIQEKSGKMGIGSGIVWDSIPESEYRECILKHKFLQNAIPFQLIESIRLKNGSLTFLNSHLLRLENSAIFFGFHFDRKYIINSLFEFIQEINQVDNFSILKVKLLLFRNGNVTLSYSQIKKEKNFGIIKINPIRINSKNYFNQHKTTNRNLYNTEYKNAVNSGLCDFVYLNEREEVVESSICNIFIKMNENLITPPLNSGALPGIMRNYLISKNWIKEKTLTIKDLEQANSIYLCNSVRGIMRVKLS